MRVLAPDLPAALIPPGALERIAGAAAPFPALAADGWILECRLGGAAAQVDLLLRAAGPGDALALVAAAERAEAPDGDGAALSIWRRVRAACEEWARPDGELAGRIEDVWLEFDLEGPRARPAPCLFVGPRGGIGGPAARARLAWLLGSVLPPLLGGPVAPDLGRAIDACVAALPPGGQIFHVGAMLPRGDGAVRLCVGGLAAAEVRPYLLRAAWPGPMGIVDSLLAEAGPRSGPVALALDVGEALRPRLGLECYAPVDDEAAPGPGWRPLLAWLEERGLCQASERAALLAWPGLRHEGEIPGRWPEELQRISSLFEHRRLSAVVRGVSHVKLVVEDGRQVEAKAYLWLRHEWLPAAGQRGARPSGRGLPC